MANLNNGKYIVEAMDSVLAQTYPNWELIVSDAASSDNSIEIVERYIAQHPEVRIALYKNDTQLCCGANKRKCIELSHGDYYIFLDPDDAFTSDALATLLSYHQKKDYSIVYATHYFCDENLQTLSISTYPGQIPHGESHLTSMKGHISAPALCSRRYYNLTEGINPMLPVSEDQDMYIKMEEVGFVAFVNKPLYFYRHHDHNTSWNEQRELLNLENTIKVRKAAYWRRKNMTIPNVSFYSLQMGSFYLLCQKHKYTRWINRIIGIWGKYKGKLCRCILRLYDRFRLRLYRYKIRRSITNKSFTIISNDCWGGKVYEDLGYQYSTPTVGLFFKPADYLRFCQRLNYYINQEIVIVGYSDEGYPIGRLDDVQVFFQHYKSAEECVEKWTRRCKRINWDNIFLKFSDRDFATQEQLTCFDRLPYPQVIFTAQSYRLNHEIVLSECVENGFVGDLYSNPWPWRNKFDVVKWLNR